MDPGAILISFVPQGTGYALFALVSYVAYRLYTDLQAEVKSHLADVKQITAESQAAAKVMTDNHVQALEKMTGVANATYSIVQNLQDLQNTSRRK